MKHPQDKTAPTLRRFPYPYQAALAICSDIDECDRAAFLAVHRFLNLDLGLPVSDSFFGRGLFPGQMAYFEADSLTPSADAPLIRQGLADGLIEALHAWGDFNDGPPDPAFLRALAERLTGELTGAGLKVPLWINHGNAQNRQNIFSRLQPGYRGDDPGSPYYTADLFGALGVHQVWNSELTTRPLSTRPRFGRATAILNNAAKNAVKRLIGRRRRIKTAALVTDLATPLELADGRRVWAFTRWAADLDEFAHPAERHNLHRSLGRERLDRLVRGSGYAIVYTHLGSAHRRDEALFFDADRNALIELAGRYHAGEIWVAATSALLDYWLVRRHLVWSWEYDETRGWLIRLEALDDPVAGRRPLTVADLAGLTFHVPDPERTRIEMNGHILSARTFQPDETGRPGLGFPVRPAPATDCLRG